jgi:peptidoglycan/LPS O-acetylase OafA/YrhL
MSVLLFHALPVALTNGDPASLAQFGKIPSLLLAHLDLGIYLFFVLSGYLLTGPFLRAYISGDPMPSVRRYLKNRALRLLPAYWLIFTIVWLRHVLLPDAFPAGFFLAPPYELAAIYGLVQNFFPASRAAFLLWPAWTLDVEVAFYLLIPIAAVLALRFRPRPASAMGRTLLILATIAVVAAASVAFRQASPPDNLWLRSIPAMLVCFLPGVFLAAVEPLLAPKMRTLRRGHLVALALVPLGLVFLYFYHRVAGFTPASNPAAPSNRVLLAVVGTGCLVAGPLVWQWSGRPAWAVLDNRLLHWLGTHSYSIYLLHWCIAGELVAFGAGLAPPVHSALLVALLVPATLLASAVTYRFVERPFLDLKQRAILARNGERRLRRGMAGGLALGLALVVVMSVSAAPGTRVPTPPSDQTAEALPSPGTGGGQAAGAGAQASPAPTSSAAPGSGGTTGAGQPPAQPQPAAGVSACAAVDTLQSLSSFAGPIVPGTSVGITTNVKNVSGRACTLPPTAPALTVTDVGGRKVFEHCTPNSVCDPVPAILLAPGSTVSQTVTWDGQSVVCAGSVCHSSPVPPGKYAVVVDWAGVASVPVTVAAPPTSSLP